MDAKSVENKIHFIKNFPLWKTKWKRNNPKKQNNIKETGLLEKG